MSCCSKPLKQKRKTQDSVLFFFHFSSFNEIPFFSSSKSLFTALLCLHLKYSLKHSRQPMKNLPSPWKNFVTRRAQVFKSRFSFSTKNHFSAKSSRDFQISLGFSRIFTRIFQRLSGKVQFSFTN